MEAKTVVRRAEWFELNPWFGIFMGKVCALGQQKPPLTELSRLSEVNLKDDGDPRVFLHKRHPGSLPKLLLN